MRSLSLQYLPLRGFSPHSRVLEKRPTTRMSLFTLFFNLDFGNKRPWFNFSGSDELGEASLGIMSEVIAKNNHWINNTGHGWRPMCNPRVPRPNFSYLAIILYCQVMKIVWRLPKASTHATSKSSIARKRCSRRKVLLTLTKGQKGLYQESLWDSHSVFNFLARSILTWVEIWHVACHAEWWGWCVSLQRMPYHTFLE